MLALYRVGYGDPPRWLTLNQLEQLDDWMMLHPELRRRLIAMFDASGDRVGHGGGGRSAKAQETLFRSRYIAVIYKTPILWDGHYWEKLPRASAAAPPGRSFHEASTPDGWALAADVIGDLIWVGVRAAEFGLRDFSDVNDEPWHVQPIEIPNNRATYAKAPGLFPLHDWIQSTRHQTMKDDDMLTARLYRDPRYWNMWLVGAGSPVHLTPKLKTSYEQAGVILVEEEHDQLLESLLHQCGLTAADLLPSS